METLREILGAAGRRLARNHHRPVVRKLDRVLVQLHEAIENRNYNFHQNGEKVVLAKLGEVMDPATVFDVGANSGQWTLTAATCFPRAQIHAFEIVPDTFEDLVATCGALPSVHLNCLGLADSEREVDVYFDSDRSELASCVNAFAEDFHGYEPGCVSAQVTTGDIYCERNGVRRIDLLKIDVEGFEGRVLEGFQGMLASGSISTVQFEYGFVSIATKFLLKDLYDFFRPYDMVVGKIYPRYVDFREYVFNDENFIGPNFIAVHASLKPVIDRLSSVR